MTYEIIYEACVKAVKTMGSDIKTLSWFKRNWAKTPQQATDSITKKAA